MRSFEEIKLPVEKTLKDFDVFFKESLKSKTYLLNSITRYIYNTKGKQVRPLLVFLTSGMFEKEVDKSVYEAATILELIHTATLVHDDIVDDSHLRRGFFSIKHLWKSRIAVLVGDYILAKGFLLCVKSKNQRLLEEVSIPIKEMSEGELLQIDKSKKLDIDEKTYFDIIYGKTASLLGACTAAGAITANVEDSMVNKAREFGKYLGIIFQIKDDLLDFEKTDIVGKPAGNDIKEQKITLPLIHVLGKADKSSRREMLRIVKYHNKNNKKVAKLIEIIRNNGGIDYAMGVINDYKQKALECLSEFPDNKYRQSLTYLLEFIINRKK